MSQENEAMCPKPGRFGWNELIVPDTKAAGDFYGNLFGWQPTPFVPKGTPAGTPPYTLFKMEGVEMGVGGMMQPMHPGTPSQWVPYVVVENADAALAKAAKLGAKVLVPVMAINEVGRIAVFQDPQGATFGVHELAK